VDDPDKVKKKKKKKVVYRTIISRTGNLRGSKPVGFGVVGRLYLPLHLRSLFCFESFGSTPELLSLFCIP